MKIVAETEKVQFSNHIAPYIRKYEHINKK